MLRVTADVFSGRPNPSWIITSDRVQKKLLSGVKGRRSVIAKEDRVFGGLGLRTLFVEVLGEGDEDKSNRVPSQFALAIEGAGASLAATLIKEMSGARNVVLPEHSLTPVDRKMQSLLLQELKYAKGRKWHRAIVKYATATRRTVKARGTRCYYEISRFNPAFWNTDPTVKRWNNCYNYARNWRTNTFAQPGRAHGAQTSTMKCPNVANAAMADGLVRTTTCLPSSEYPRRHMALVIWPNVDYHWYREQIGGFWGHKPGQTAARNTDNSGALVVSPESCDRGNYIHFCGYFYAGKSVVIA